MNDQAARVSLTLAAVSGVALAVHFASILLLPRVAPLDAFSRLAAPAAPGAVTLLPPASDPANPLPWRDPLVASAICRFDLDQGSFKVFAPLSGGAFEAFSLYTRRGTAFYGLNDRAGNEGTLSVTLMSQAQFDKAKAADEDSEPKYDVRVVSPTIEGFAKFDVLARIGGYAEAERMLRSVRCEVERRP